MAAIAEVYKGGRWLYKVENMHDNQVIAVYYSFLEKGKFDKPKSEYKDRRRRKRGEEIQITLDDLFK